MGKRYHYCYEQKRDGGLLAFWRDVRRRLSTWTLRHNVALKVLFFEMLTSSLLTLLVLAVEPKALYESENDQEFWDVPVYAEHTFV